MDIIGIFLSWQAVVLAVACVGIAQLVKTAIDVIKGRRIAKTVDKSARKIGRELRQESLVLNRIVMPMVPIIVGAVFAAIIPLRPEFIVEYVTTHVSNPWLAALCYAVWGGACGQFSSHTYDKVREVYAAKQSSSGDNGFDPGI